MSAGRFLALVLVSGLGGAALYPMPCPAADASSSDLSDRPEVRQALAEITRQTSAMLATQRAVAMKQELSAEQEQKLDALIAGRRKQVDALKTQMLNGQAPPDRTLLDVGTALNLTADLQDIMTAGQFISYRRTLTAAMSPTVEVDQTFTQVFDALQHIDLTPDQRQKVDALRTDIQQKVETIKADMKARRINRSDLPAKVKTLTAQIGSSLGEILNEGQLEKLATVLSQNASRTPATQAK